ncbi:hypothetical protein EKO04_011318 [Ascochyta lentis]|uniref:F-box domain-containing protein n=1 Tax=Ascochyta lentis TaxID=205686 RepID=A0A8H7MDC3_9PLEO|nr:hypothetical protein EKO04_011318 [Ascochyta lentis]
MAPTTRSASKRAADPSIPPGPVAGTQRRSYKKARKGKRALVDTGPLRCYLLEMPPEIRNRIYGFCSEQTFGLWYTPCALRKSEKPVDVPQHLKSRTFFALTQTCNQIRSEYRPLWLRQSSVRIDFDDVHSFMETFYRPPGLSHVWYLDAPRLVTISWDHDKALYTDGNAFLDITSILKLRAFTPSSTIRFASRRLEEHDLGHRACWNCEECITCCGDDSDYNFDLEPLYSHPCSHEDTIDDAFEELENAYAYLHPLNDFLENGNEAWLQAIRDKPLHLMAVHCTMGWNRKVPTIYIRFDKNSVPLPLRPKSMYKTAAAYLSQMGIMDLRLRKGLDFMVGVSTGKYMRPLAGASPVVAMDNQTHICGRTYKAAPAAIKRVTNGPNA